MLTAEQIRAARALLRLDQAQLAEKAKVSVETIKRLEGQNGPVGANVQTIEAIQSALRREGVELIDSGSEGGYGVRLVPRTPEARKQALQRSYELLRRWLNPAQLEQFDSTGVFDVVGSQGGRYRLTHTVEELGDDGEVICHWCFAPAEDLPRGDVLLAQKIGLETDEAGIRAIANMLVGPKKGLGKKRRTT